MNGIDPPNWTLNSCFGAFHSVWVHLGSFRNCIKLGAKRGKLVQLMQKLSREVMTGFFSTNTPNPPWWNLNKCFSLFHSISMHLGSFRNCMNVGAKRGELVQLLQKFVPRSHVGIFRNERNQSTPLDPIPMFRCVS